MQYCLAAFVVLLTVFIVLWDFYFVSIDQPHNTVTSIIRGWSLDFPVIPFTAGLISGHLFWSSKT